MFFRRYNLDHIFDKTLRSQIERNEPEFEKITKLSGYDNKRNRWTRSVFSMTVEMMMEILVDELMEGNRVATPKGRYWAIKKAKKWGWYPEPLFGNRHTVQITGLPYDYAIMLSRKKRRQLRDLVKKGKTYY